MTTANTTGSTTAAMTTAADTTSTTTIAEDTTPATAESTSIAPDITTATGFNSATVYICDLGNFSREGVSIPFIVKVNISVSDLSNKTSPLYISLREELRQQMFDILNVTVDALIDVCVLNMSQGSVIADLTAVVGKNTSEQSASQLTLALRTLDRGQVFSLNNQSGTVDVTTTDGKSFSQVGVCEAFNSIYTCVNGSQCVEENGSPSCTPTEDSGSDEWKIILGVCLGIPLAVIIAVNIFCLVRYRRRRAKNVILDDYVSESGSYPTMANLFGLPGASMFDPDGKRAAWNYNESISSMPDLHRNEDDRFSQFYRGLAGDREFTIKRPQVDL